MKFNYYRETDSLYIDLSEKKSVDSKEVAPGVVGDFDETGTIVGIDIDHAAKLSTSYHRIGLSTTQDCKTMTSIRRFAGTDRGLISDSKLMVWVVPEWAPWDVALQHGRSPGLC